MRDQSTQTPRESRDQSTQTPRESPISEADLQQLAEPTRSQALELYRNLLAEGRSSADAARTAFRQAEEWETTRAPSMRVPEETRRVRELRQNGAAPEGTTEPATGSGQSRR
jgi:uncharacterized protein YdaT